MPTLKDYSQMISDAQYYSTMERVAKENWRAWGDPSEEESLLRLLNSNEYDYRGFYGKYPNAAANASTHWPDEFKTVYYPTFSTDSRYSGVVDPNYNPSGLVGGSWSPFIPEFFIPNEWQQRRKNKNKFDTGGITEFSLTPLTKTQYWDFRRRASELGQGKGVPFSRLQEAYGWQAMPVQHVDNPQKYTIEDYNLPLEEANPEEKIITDVWGQPVPSDRVRQGAIFAYMNPDYKDPKLKNIWDPNKLPNDYPGGFDNAANWLVFDALTGKGALKTGYNIGKAGLSALSRGITNWAIKHPKAAAFIGDTAAGMAMGEGVNEGARAMGHDSFGDGMAKTFGGDPFWWDFANPGYLVAPSSMYARSAASTAANLADAALNRAYPSVGVINAVKQLPAFANDYSKGMFNVDLSLFNDITRPYRNRIDNFSASDAINNGRNWVIDRLGAGKNSTITPIAETPEKIYDLQRYPGYMLKSLLPGNPLEMQLSSDGTIAVNSIKALVNKGSAVEKEVVEKVLNNNFKGAKTIDYNKFRKAVQDELITYERKSTDLYNDYGINALGFKTQQQSDLESIVFNDITGEFEQAAPFKEFQPEYELHTYTFASPRIPYGNDKHFDSNTLGHSRTYTTKDEPNILHVMESQSDWAQNPRVMKNKSVPKFLEQYQNRKNRLEDDINMWERVLRTGVLPNGEKAAPYALTQIETDFLPSARYKYAELIKKYEKVTRNISPQEYYLISNYEKRQIQENLKYAAEQGQTKMRYPTRETAAKVEGYTKHRRPFKDGIQLNPQDFNDYNPNTRDFEKYIYPEGIEVRDVYNPEYETILRKYDNFPNQFKKLYKDAEVRTVTDARGNTWYEVDVPKDFLQQEIPFKYGGKLNRKQ